MCIEKIRQIYKVPAKVGGKILYNGRIGKITGTRHAYLLVRLEGEKKSGSYHPTYNLQYL